MSIKDILEKAKRKGREPMGTGYGVHGAGQITETGGKSYKALADPIIKQKRKDDFKNGAKKVIGTIQKHAKTIAEAQERNEGPADPIRFNMGFGGREPEGMGLGLSPERKPEPAPKTEATQKTKKKDTTITLPDGKTITISS